jgi:hypothetical protein
MKRTHSIALGLVAATGLALAATLAVAHPGGGWGPGAGNGPGYGMGHGMGYGMGHGWGGGHMMGWGGGPYAGEPLFNAEEQNTFREQMRNATTAEERQRIAQEHRTEAQRRAADRRIDGPGLAPAPAK